MPRAASMIVAVAAAAALAGVAATAAAAAGGGLGPGSKPGQTAPLATPIAVFGADDRVAVPSRYRRQQGGIGLLYNRQSKTVCTAFCVAENTVATAGHCLFRTAGETAPPINAFAFTRTRGSSGGSVRIAGSADQSASQNVVAGSMRLSVRPPIDAANDWALVRLERPACAGHVLPLEPISADEIAKAAAEQRIFQLSYHRDYADWRLAYSQPCGAGRNISGPTPATLARDFSDPTNLILHTCDTGGASSGSPLLVETARGISVIGINVGTYVQSEVVIEEGNVVRRSKAAAVANTGVSAASFQTRLSAFRAAEILPTGERIRSLQDGLRKRRLYDGPLDGRYGTKLRDAIIAYENTAGVAPTGIASQELLARLQPAGPPPQKHTAGGRPSPRSRS